MSVRFWKRLLYEFKERFCPYVSVIVKFSFGQRIKYRYTILLCVKILIIASINFHQDRMISIVPFFDISKNLSTCYFIILLFS